ncbi:MAG: tRNA adenosine(34) deaminase TadA [Pseudomonadota bacterium]|nr:tRNA adenosine(34) deaminase TadA [Pseudomonadota bacterium]
MTQDDAWMDLALAEARAAGAAGEVPVGAVIVRDGDIVCAAGNRLISPPDPTGHAEMRALRQAAAVLGNYRLNGCVLYVTLEPCVMCFGAMVHARLRRLVFAAPDEKTGACGGAIDLPALYPANHTIDVASGPRREEAAALLRAFFRTRRG